MPVRTPVRRTATTELADVGTAGARAVEATAVAPSNRFVGAGPGECPAWGTPPELAALSSCATRRAPCWRSRPTPPARRRRASRRRGRRALALLPRLRRAVRPAQPRRAASTAAGRPADRAARAAAAPSRPRRVPRATPTTSPSWRSRCTTPRPARPSRRRSCCAGCTGGRPGRAGGQRRTRRCSSASARARVDPDRVAALLGLPDARGGRSRRSATWSFRDPERDGAWVSRARVPVRRRPGQARAAAGGRAGRPALPPQRRRARRGRSRRTSARSTSRSRSARPWIAAEDVEAFVHEVLGGRVKVWHLPSAASWKIVPLGKAPVGGFGRTAPRA